MSRKVLRVRRAPATIRSVQLIEQGAGTPQEAIARHAQERAYAEGVREGTRQANEQAAKALDQATAQLEALRERASADMGRTSTQLATAIAQRVLRTEIDTGRYNLERIVRETLHAASAQRSPCVVHLNPDDMELLRDARFRAGTTLQADPGVRRGDVQVETTLGLLVRDVEDIVQDIGERIASELP